MIIAIKTEQSAGPIGIMECKESSHSFEILNET